MKRLAISILVIGILFLIVGCEKKSEVTNDTLPNIYNVDGVAQKGPFIIGSTIIISELNSDLSPSGKNYYSTIIDNKGTFHIPDVEFNSSYVQLIADGTYYNEIRGYYTTTELALTAISNLNDSNTVNINMLTNLEIERLIYLIENDSLSFTDAKTQAQEEILSIFSINIDNMTRSEYLNIFEEEDYNGSLLAISSIIQGYRSVNELTEMLTKIKIDIKEDGILDDNEIKTDLRSHAELLKFNKIEEYLKNQFDLDILSDFQKYIYQFLDNSDFDTYLSIDIPIRTEFGKNLLCMENNSVLYQDSLYCIAANVVYEDYLSLSVFLEKEESITWNYPYYYGRIDTVGSDVIGWSGHVYYDELSAYLEELNALSIVPLQFGGNGILNLELYINIAPLGEITKIKEFKLE